MAHQPSWVIYAKTTLVENNIKPTAREDKEVHTLVSPKVHIIVPLEFELAYNGAAVWYFNYYAMADVKRWINAFPNEISGEWNANSLDLDLNFRIDFLGGGKPWCYQ